MPEPTFDSYSIDTELVTVVPAPHQRPAPTDDPEAEFVAATVNVENLIRRMKDARLLDDLVTRQRVRTRLSVLAESVGIYVRRH